jgi:hypothetical protein
LQEAEKQLEGKYALKKYQSADLLELARIYDPLGELPRVASTPRVYTRQNHAHANAPRELAQVTSKLNSEAGARMTTGLADAADPARKP